MDTTTTMRSKIRADTTIVICVVLLMVLCAGPAGADSIYGPTVSSISPQIGYNMSALNITNLAGTYFTSGATVTLMPAGYPILPVKVGSLVNGAGGAKLDGAQAVFVKGDKAYVASNTSDALEIVNISTPSAPIHAGSITNGTGGAFLNGASGVFVYGKYAYVTSRDSDALEIVNIANAASPTHVANVTNGTASGWNTYLLKSPAGVYVANESSGTIVLAYVVSTGSNALQIIDVTNPAKPSFRGVISNTNGAVGNLSGPRSVFVSGEYAYIASSNSNALEIVDISNSWDPSHAGILKDGTGGAVLNKPYSVQVAGNYAYVASYGSRALEIVNVTDPENPKHAGKLVNGTGGAWLDSPVSVTLSGIYAYVVNRDSNRLEVIDISNPAAPKHKGGLNLGAGYGPTGVSVAGNYAYIASNLHKSLDVVQVSTGVFSATGVKVTNLYHENAKITCNLPLTGKPFGVYSVVVTNPDLQQAVLVNGFVISRKPGALPEPYPGWKFRGVLNSTGMYNDGGSKPNGKLLWNSTGVKFTDSTPAVVDGIVYVGGGLDKKMYALFANNGTVKWKKTVTDVIYGGPAATNGIVYVGVGANPNVNNTFYALNASTGGTIWLKNLPGGVDSSPAIYNGTVYVGRRDGNVSAWNAKTGAEVWRFKTSGWVFSPAVSNGRVFVATSDWNLFALDATTGAKVWDGRNSSSGWDASVVLESSPAVAYGKVYIGGEYAVYAFDELTGALLYKYPIPGAYLDDSPAVANGLVYIATSGGGPSGGNAIYALNANNLTKRWVNHTPENTIMESSPAVANGVVYITSDRANNPAKGFLYAWNAATGTPLWSFQLPGGGTASSPAVVDGVVYFGQWWDGVLAVGTQHPIFVTVPNGGQKWKQGSTQTIRWLYSGSPGSKVKIELLKGTTVNRVINASTAIGSKGSGSYSWKILSNQIVGTNYKIRIKSTSNPALTDTSNEVFTISA